MMRRYAWRDHGLVLMISTSMLFPLLALVATICSLLSGSRWTAICGLSPLVVGLPILLAAWVLIFVRSKGEVRS